MLDAKIGVIPNELPIVFIDNNFFQALSTKDSSLPEETSEDEEEEDISIDSLNEEVSKLDESLDELDEMDISSGEFLFDDDDVRD